MLPAAPLAAAQGNLGMATFNAARCYSISAWTVFFSPIGGQPGVIDITLSEFKRPHVAQLWQTEPGRPL
jgi:hypothetical protein